MRCPFNRLCPNAYAISGVSTGNTGENTGKSGCKQVNSALTLWFRTLETDCGDCFCVFISYVLKGGELIATALRTDGCCYCRIGGGAHQSCELFKTGVSFWSVFHQCVPLFLCASLLTAWSETSLLPIPHRPLFAGFYKPLKFFIYVDIFSELLNRTCRLMVK